MHFNLAATRNNGVTPPMMNVAYYMSVTTHTMKNILITGANGLIARIVAKRLNKTGYNLFGVDIDPQGVPSFRFQRENNTNNALLQECPYTAYYQVDMTVKYQFAEVITKIGQIDCVIHLAGVSDNETPAKIKKINEGGTQTLFDICQEQKIDNVILASSVMTVWGKLVDDKIYLQDAKSLTRVNVTAVHIPKDISLPLLAYINSKVSMEKIALQSYNTYQISSVCMRIGAVSCDNSTYADAGVNTIWCSHADIASFTEHAVVALTAMVLPFFGVYYVCSANEDCWVDMEGAKKDIGFEPCAYPAKKLASELQQNIMMFGRNQLIGNSSQEIQMVDERKIKPPS
jgi:dTDP-4-dehydrorhamnose reductase